VLLNGIYFFLKKHGKVWIIAVYFYEYCSYESPIPSGRGILSLYESDNGFPGRCYAIYDAKVIEKWLRETYDVPAMGPLPPVVIRSRDPRIEFLKNKVAPVLFYMIPFLLILIFLLTLKWNPIHQPSVKRSP